MNENDDDTTSLEKPEDHHPSDDDQQATRKSLMRISCLIILHSFLGLSISTILTDLHIIDGSELKVDVVLLVALLYLFWKYWQYLTEKDEWQSSFNFDDKLRNIIFKYLYKRAKEEGVKRFLSNNADDKSINREKVESRPVQIQNLFLDKETRNIEVLMNTLRAHFTAPAVNRVNPC